MNITPDDSVWFHGLVVKPLFTSHERLWDVSYLYLWRIWESCCYQILFQVRAYVCVSLIMKHHTECERNGWWYVPLVMFWSEPDRIQALLMWTLRVLYLWLNHSPFIHMTNFEYGFNFIMIIIGLIDEDFWCECFHWHHWLLFGCVNVMSHFLYCWNDTCTHTQTHTVEMCLFVFTVMGWCWQRQVFAHIFHTAGLNPWRLLAAVRSANPVRLIWRHRRSHRCRDGWVSNIHVSKHRACLYFKT